MPYSPMPSGGRQPLLVLPLLGILLALSAAAGSEAGFSAAHVEHIQHKVEHESRGHDPARRAHRMADATHGLIKSGREPLSTELNPLQELASTPSGSLAEDAERALSSGGLLLQTAIHTAGITGRLSNSEHHRHELAGRNRLESTAEDAVGTAGVSTLDSTRSQGVAGSAASAAYPASAKSRRLQRFQEGSAKEAGEFADGQSVGLLQRYDELSEVMDLVADESVLEQNQAAKETQSSFGDGLFGSSLGWESEKIVPKPRLIGGDVTRGTGAWVADGALSARRAGAGRNSNQWARSSDELDLLEDEEMSEEEESGWLGSWWPLRGSQTPARPTAKRRKFGTGMQPRGRLAQLTSHFTLGNKQTIPKIIHQVYMEGEEALLEVEERETAGGSRFPKYRRGWRESCKLQHPEWEFKLWNLTMAETLLQEHYAWFLPTFQSYAKMISKADAIRPFILHAFGGLYLDVDTECFAPTDPLLEDHEIVLQLEDSGTKSLTNAVVAGVKGQPFWETWQHLLYLRAPALSRKKPLWWTMQQEFGTVLNSTGPWLLRSVFREFTRDAGELRLGYAGAWRVNNTDLMVYPMGLWFVPCVWNNFACHDRVEAMALHRTLPRWLVGHHKNSGSWHAQMHGAWDSPLRWVFLILAGGVVYLLVQRYRQGQAQRAKIEKAGCLNVQLPRYKHAANQSRSPTKTRRAMD